jgi:Ca-activated chloride channel family protein
LPNTLQNRTKAIAYINKLDANGGTELLNGIQTVLNFSAAQSERLRSIVLLTDGYIGNELEVIASVQKQLKPGNRLYSLVSGVLLIAFYLIGLQKLDAVLLKLFAKMNPLRKSLKSSSAKLITPY